MVLWKIYKDRFCKTLLKLSIIYCINILDNAIKYTGKDEKVNIFMEKLETYIKIDLLYINLSECGIIIRIEK